MSEIILVVSGFSGLTSFSSYAGAAAAACLSRRSTSLGEIGRGGKSMGGLLIADALKQVEAFLVEALHLDF